jgi:hypothetical protein
MIGALSARGGKAHRLTRAGDRTGCGRPAITANGGITFTLTYAPNTRMCRAPGCWDDAGPCDVIALAGGQNLYVHPGSQCEGTVCAIHNPSGHALNTAPYIWRDDRHPPLLERLCPHGVGHPDRDALTHWRATGMADVNVHAHAVHGCDGCCA